MKEIDLKLSYYRINSISSNKSITIVFSINNGDHRIPIKKNFIL